MKEILKVRIEDLTREYAEQARLLQAHYEGRVAELRRMVEQEEEKEKAEQSENSAPF